VRAAAKRLDTRLPLPAGRLPVDVPRVRVPWRDVAEADADVRKGQTLPLGRRVVVLDAEKARADAVLGHRTGVSQDGQDSRIHAAVTWRHVRQPPTPVLIAQGVDKLVDRLHMRRIAIPLLLKAERLISHPPGHGLTLSHRRRGERNP
jgi:hypothetical protein